jgi:hydroxymethylglutaryl-CoA reductase (NADPH)
MPATHLRVLRHLKRLMETVSVEEMQQRLKRSQLPAPPRIPGGASATLEAVEKRWELFPHATPAKEQLLDSLSRDSTETYARNIENLIGTVKLPVGLAGPLRVQGVFAQGDYYVPLATTEAALVASYSRGALVMTEAGGCTALLLNEGVSRAPGFAFRRLEDAALFAIWASEQWESLVRVAATQSAHGQLQDMRVTIEGNHVYLNFEFYTGDASGQNMVTIATEAICAYLLEHCPTKPEYHFLEANFSGDKKVTLQSFLTVRGRKVSAEVELPPDLVQRRLHTSAARMVDYWRMAAIGGVMSGTTGLQGHYANGLAALYLACGQDVACVAESAVGVTRFELLPNGGLYASVTLPNLIVGTVGGGTGLPSQAACLDLMGLKGNGRAQAFAEVAAALCLGGELSIIAALCAGHFARAHAKLARGKR